jgi:hypothetical protein
MAGRALVTMAFAFAIPATISTWSVSAAAQPLDEAQGKEFAREAMGHYKDNEYEDALVKFKQARALYPAGQVLRMTGYTLIALEKWVGAAEVLTEALAAELKPLLPRDAEHAQDQLALALEHVAKIELSSSVDGAKGAVDDGDEKRLPLTVFLEPGGHRFIITAPGHAPVEREQDVSAGQQARIELDPTALTPEEPEPVAQPKPPKPKAKPEPEEPSDMFGWFPGQGIAGLATAGLGVAFTGVAIGTGIYGSTLRSAVRDNINAHNQSYDGSCSSNTDSCLADISIINRDGERAKSYQNAAMGLGIAGGSLIAVGAALFLFSDMSPLAPADGGGGADGVSLTCVPGAALPGMSALPGTSWQGAGLSCHGTF